MITYKENIKTYLKIKSLLARYCLKLITSFIMLTYACFM